QSPTPQDRIAEREPHRSATAVQLQHERFASRDRQQLASVNHGMPAIVATPRANEFRSAGVAGGGRNAAQAERFRSERAAPQERRAETFRGEQRAAPQERRAETFRGEQRAAPQERRAEAFRRDQRGGPPAAQPQARVPEASRGGGQPQARMEAPRGGGQPQAAPRESVARAPSGPPQGRPEGGARREGGRQEARPEGNRQEQRGG